MWIGLTRSVKTAKTNFKLSPKTMKSYNAIALAQFQNRLVGFRQSDGNSIPNIYTEWNTWVADPSGIMHFMASKKGPLPSFISQSIRFESLRYVWTWRAETRPWPLFCCSLPPVELSQICMFVSAVNRLICSCKCNKLYASSMAVPYNTSCWTITSAIVEKRQKSRMERCRNRSAKSIETRCSM